MIWHSAEETLSSDNVKLCIALSKEPKSFIEKKNWINCDTHSLSLLALSSTDVVSSAFTLLFGFQNVFDTPLQG